MKQLAITGYFQIPTFTFPLGAGGQQDSSLQTEFMATTFDYPFSELIIWAVLTKRKEMAKLVWEHGKKPSQLATRQSLSQL